MIQPLIVIVGPTASGKSALAMKVAKTYDGEIICADSRTVYAGMDIGTAKPTTEDRLAVPHHLLDVVAPDQSFTAADFKRLADEAIASIRRRGRVPILVGGTGLYVDAVIFNYRFGDLADPKRRAQLMAMSLDELLLFCRDNNIEIPFNSQNKRHVVRAIELNGLPKVNRSISDQTFVVGISTNRDDLRTHVSKRAAMMFQSGIVAEVETLATRYGWDHESMTGNIYRVLRGVIEGSKTREEAIEEFIRSDMLLAKRQTTWFKRNPFIKWGSAEELFKAISDRLLVVKK